MTDGFREDQMGTRWDPDGIGPCALFNFGFYSKVGATAAFDAEEGHEFPFLLV